MLQAVSAFSLSSWSQAILVSVEVVSNSVAPWCGQLHYYGTLIQFIDQPPARGPPLLQFSDVLHWEKPQVARGSQDCGHQGLVIWWQGVWSVTHSDTIGLRYLTVSVQNSRNIISNDILNGLPCKLRYHLWIFDNQSSWLQYIIKLNQGVPAT